MRIYKAYAWFSDGKPFITLEEAMEESISKFVCDYLEVGPDADFEPRDVAKFILANRAELIRLLEEENQVGE